MSGHNLILAVDDEPRILRSLRTTLQLAGFEVLTAEDGPRALRQIENHTPDIVLLDLGLPGLNGFDVIQQIRRFSEVPIIILTARDSEEDKVRGLQLGADDYLTKPFSPRELEARIQAVLRRTRSHRTSNEAPVATYTNGGLKVNYATREVTMDGTLVHLTPTEYKLLGQFIDNPNKVLSHSFLLIQVWGTEYSEDVHILRANIWRLRQKLEPDANSPLYIISEPGVGYRMMIVKQPVLS